MVTVAGETLVTSHSKSVEEQRPEDPFPKSHTLLPSLSCRLSDLLPVPGDAAQLDTEVTRAEGPLSCPRGWAGGGVSRHTLAGNPGSQATLWASASFSVIWAWEDLENQVLPALDWKDLGLYL